MEPVMGKLAFGKRVRTGALAIPHLRSAPEQPLLCYC